MSHSLEIKEGKLFKDKSGLEVKVERIDANRRIRFSIVGDQPTIAGPGEMSLESFANRFLPSVHVSTSHLGRKKAA
jgi:hypothetical protein